MRKNRTGNMRTPRKFRSALLVTSAAAFITALTGLTVRLHAATAPVTSMHPPADHLLFTTSLHCVACHSKVYTPGGEDISIGYQWRASVMANSSRDPYWQAGIRRESIDHPTAKAAIEDTCSRCHMPMQRFQARAENKMGEVFRYLEAIRSGAATVEPEARLEEVADPKATLAADGVSCTVCHQIQPDNFGQEESLDGNFRIDFTTGSDAKAAQQRATAILARNQQANPVRHTVNVNALR